MPRTGRRAAGIFLVFIVAACGGGGGGNAAQGIGAGVGCIFDTIPVNFTPVSDADLSKAYVSNEVGTGGLCANKVIEINGGGEYSINGGPWSVGRNTIVPGYRVRVRVTSAATLNTTRSATVRIGSLQANGNLNPLETSAGTFRVTTRSGQAGDAPTALIISPVDQEVVDAPTVTVIGTADDPDGIFEVRVNGVLATSNDGFDTWEAEIELVTGTNTITVATADDLLNRNPQAAVIDIENLAILLRNPQAIVSDHANERLLVVDDDWKAVVAIDLLSDQHSFVSDQAAGTAFVTPRRIAVSPARNRAWVIDDGYEHLIQIDLATGLRSLLVGPGDLLREMRDLSIDETRNRLLVMRSKFSTNNDDTQIYAVDMATGARQVLSDNVTPSNADPFTFATAIVFDDAGDRLLVLQRNGNAAYAVDPVSGARSVFADDTIAVGHPVSAVIEAPQARVLLADRFAGAIRSMNLLTGDAQLLWQVPDEPAQIALDRANGRLLVQLRYEDDIGAIDMATGQYSIAY